MIQKIDYPQWCIDENHKMDRTHYDTPGSIAGCPCAGCNETRRIYKKTQIHYYERVWYYVDISDDYRDSEGVIDFRMDWIFNLRFESEGAAKAKIVETFKPDYHKYLSVYRGSDTFLK